MNLHKKKNINPNFNISSMTDIIFLLIIFFMITSSFGNINSININLPTSQNINKVQKDLEITISQNGYFYKEKNYTFEMLRMALEEDYLKKKFMKCLIKSDKDISILQVINIADLVKAISPSSKIAIATKKE